MALAVLSWMSIACDVRATELCDKGNSQAIEDALADADECLPRNPRPSRDSSTFEECYYQSYEATYEDEFPLECEDGGGR